MVTSCHGATLLRTKAQWTIGPQRSDHRTMFGHTGKVRMRA